MSTTIRIPIPPVLLRSPPHAQTPDTPRPLQETKFATRRGNRRNSRISISHYDAFRVTPVVIHAPTCYPTTYTYGVSKERLGRRRCCGREQVWGEAWYLREAQVGSLAGGHLFRGWLLLSALAAGAAGIRGTGAVFHKG